ncbi:biofilm development regulator YmgB/AriR family protein [Enterobacteriaceae bacterium H20N1]|uniref:Biofilm development regulator YmgB/AriR family protein n=1 Tax=Dryocola boscaweniae TaxID=2925397 RepID=A0A9X2W9N8_9ENTR|nr:biofilm development regulator YmgB/AriR family protein [Dryocola boscaweniae]MCT4703111.1 biofilm development regulator YmgB/AriR family protein [Dryocola boscaweniae]MCT4720279.1 biofilm development regulator YmgB/AriR family protein [Dryocola boscaweniae]
MLMNTVRNDQQEEKAILAADFSAADATWQLGNVVLEIVTSGKPPSNKEVIAALVKRLEFEDDVLTLDTYRQLLEYVVYQTAGES